MRLLRNARLETTRARDVFVLDGERLPVQFGSIASMLRFGGLAAGDKIRVAASILPLLARYGGALRADADEEISPLDDVSARAFVETAVSAKAANVLVEPPLNAFYGLRGSETSRAFFLTLGRYGSSGDLVATRNGWSQTLATVLGDVRIEYGASVTALESNGHQGVVATTEDGRTWSADGAVLAVSASAARNVLRGYLRDDDPLVDWLSSIPLRETWTVALTLRRPFDTKTFGVLADPRAAVYVSACATPSGRWDDSDDASIVLAWPTPDAITRLSGNAAHEIVAAMMPEIEQLVPEVRDAVETGRVVRFDEGSALASPGFLSHRRRGRALAAALDAPIALAGDYLTMPFVEGAVVSGERAADQIVRRLGMADR
jgi:oxygen-dependent protoporphyrinogen oxidase